MAHADVDRKPLCQGRARNDRQPRASENQCNDGGMHPLNCAAISWALDVSVSSASASRLLIEIARRSEGGRCAATQKALGEACKLSERQTRTLIKGLIRQGAIIEQKFPGLGAGRTASTYYLCDGADLDIRSVTVKRKPIGRQTKQYVFQRDDFSCCGCRTSNSALLIDHILPIALGGDNSPDNLQLLCKPCHLEKGRADTAVWVRA